MHAPVDSRWFSPIGELAAGRISAAAAEHGIDRGKPGSSAGSECSVVRSAPGNGAIPRFPGKAEFCHDHGTFTRGKIPSVGHSRTPDAKEALKPGALYSGTASPKPSEEKIARSPILHVSVFLHRSFYTFPKNRPLSGNIWKHRIPDSTSERPIGKQARTTGKNAFLVLQTSALPLGYRALLKECRTLQEKNHRASAEINSRKTGLSSLPYATSRLMTSVAARTSAFFKAPPSPPDAAIPCGSRTKLAGKDSRA